MAKSLNEILVITSADIIVAGSQAFRHGIMG